MTSLEPIAQPLADGGGLSAAPVSERDPFEILDDLMAVMEVLCPEWPARGIFTSSMEFRI